MSEFVFIMQGNFLTKKLGLKEYVVIPTALKISGTDETYEMHLQVSWLKVLKYFVRKLFGKPFNTRSRLEEMLNGYYHDMEQIARQVKSGVWAGKTVGFVATSHLSMLKAWQRAVVRSGGEFYWCETCIDPAARLGKFGWWLSQVASFGTVTDGKPPEQWSTCIVLYKGEILDDPGKQSADERT